MNDMIKSQIVRLVNKHKTRDPFDIAFGENIIVVREPLGSIYGYYSKYVRQPFIHVNSDLDKRSQIFTCCHELGHAVIHADSNTQFLRYETFFSVDRLERQANSFAAELLISDDDIKQFFGTGLCISRVAKELQVREIFVEYKIKNMSVDYLDHKTEYMI